MNLLDLGYIIAAGLTAPVWARKARGDWRRRFGHADALPPPAPGRPRILLHAVSVGEVSALRSLVPLLVQPPAEPLDPPPWQPSSLLDAMATPSDSGGAVDRLGANPARQSTSGAEVVISVGTDTGIARARELFSPSDSAPHHSRATSVPTHAPVHVVRYPLDFSRCVRRFLDAIKPTAVGLVELELWPNFIQECERRAIPVAVINGRLSARSFRGYQRARPILRRTFAALHAAAVQDESYAQRFIAMGVPPARCLITGSMKWDAARIEPSPVPGAADLARDFAIDPARPLIVAGSTGPGEEALLHHACLAAGPHVQLLCAPRKPERFHEAAAALPGCVRRSLTRSARRSARRSAHPAAPTPPDSPARFLLDTIGELRIAYSLADIVVVGRSFDRLYGSDPIEPIALGKPVLIGPRFGDFQSIVDAFHRAGGILITTPLQLARDLRRLLADEPARHALVRSGQACIIQHQGATRRHASLLLQMAHAAPDARPRSRSTP